MILFGVRSPLVVDYEESIARCGLTVTAAVCINGSPRLIDRSRLVLLADFVPPPGSVFLSPAFAPMRRRALSQQALALGLEAAEPLIDPTAMLPRAIRIGRGSFVNAGVTIGALSMLGADVLINRAASLGHHTVLSDFVSVGPGATLAGNIHVGEGSVIGAGATILPNVRIGANAIVSAGALVRKHVADNMLVVGNPALPHRFNPNRSSLAIEDSE